MPSKPATFISTAVTASCGDNATPTMTCIRHLTFVTQGALVVLLLAVDLEVAGEGGVVHESPVAEAAGQWLGFLLPVTQQVLLKLLLRRERLQPHSRQC